MRLFSIIFIAALTLIGCGSDKYCQVTSSTEWSGSFGNKSVDGYGDQKVDLPDDGVQCVAVQKGTTGGTLTIELCADSDMPLVPDQRNDKVTTTAEYGVVSDCID